MVKQNHYIIECICAKLNTHYQEDS